MLEAPVILFVYRNRKSKRALCFEDDTYSALLNAMKLCRSFLDADFICNLNEAMDGWKAIPDTGKSGNLWFAQDNSLSKTGPSEDEDATLVELKLERLLPPAEEKWKLKILPGSKTSRS